MNEAQTTMASSRLYSEKLKNSRVLIIGGSSGIGFGLADALLELGAQVIISSSSPQRISHAIERLRDSHPELPEDTVTGIRCDLGRFEALSDQVSHLFHEVSKRTDSLHHVVFTAGDTLPIKPLEDFSLPEMQQAGVVRFFAPLVVAQQLRKYLPQSSSSSFTLTTGGIPEHLMKNWSVAQAYLGGINSMARGFAVDLAPIRVNAIGLGPVETELWDAAKEAGVYDDIRVGFEAKMTTGKVGKVVDVVEAYLYVLKDQNVSGITTNSHGGTLLL